MGEPLPPFTCPVCGRLFDSPRGLWVHRGKTAACTPSLAESLWTHVDRSGGPDACWPWAGVWTDRKGYGRLWWRGRAYRVTHVALELDGRPVGPGQMALHHCDNPPCANPAHLFVGDNGANMRDMWAKGRGNNSPEYRRRMSLSVRAAWSNTPPEKRRLWAERISRTLTPTVRCGVPLAQSDGGCFRVPNHGGGHRSERGMLVRRRFRP